ncbi:hypothetical protein [Caulobacter mirabilis]|uniref:Uncharacterized protein n=1 Tax=Caulobacter mirabilis TaxID=69666 RepID=A0A2D2B0G7_9CAUL|nr:hypothetical protein [Caulobacter mirabilis]ATQ43731.1 hypothetical protein CSW64_15685 [Caulobacter mirabilis]
MPVHQVDRDLLRRAYDLVLAQWPEIIVPGDKTFHIGGGCNMRTLNEVREPIEDWVLGTDFPPELDAIIGSVEHYVSTCIHGALKHLTKLRKSDLDFEAFVSWFDSHPGYRVVDAPSPTEA